VGCRRFWNDHSLEWGGLVSVYADASLNWEPNSQLNLPTVKWLWFDRWVSSRPRQSSYSVIGESTGDHAGSGVDEHSRRFAVDSVSALGVYETKGPRLFRHENALFSRSPTNTNDLVLKNSHRKILLATLLVALPVIVISLSYLEDIAESGGGGKIVSFFSDLPRRALLFAAETGYAGIFTLMFLESAAFPIPSEIVLPFAGYLVSKGTLDFWRVLIYSTIAALLGSFVDYYLGLRLGPFLFHTNKVRFVNKEHLRKADAWFQEHGPTTVALLRLVPAARVLISFPAGAYHMNRAKFAGYTLAGCLPWNFILIYLGWWFGSSWDSVVGLFQYVNVAAYVFLVLLIIWIFFKMKTFGAIQDCLRRT
jgi:membrane protein DedA with SNARE-associated domain